MGTSTSEMDSESVFSFNFGDSTGVLVILVIGVVLCLAVYQLFSCCRSCSRQQRPNYDQGLNSALIKVALAVGQQQNVTQQPQHQPTGVTPGYSYSTVNHAAGFGNRTTAKCKPATATSTSARSSTTATNQSDSRLQLLYSQPGLITNGSRSTVNQAVLATVGKAAGNSGDTRV